MAETNEENVVTNGEGHFWGSIAAGVLIGVAVGGVLGILFAPKSGEALREDLEDALDNLKAQTEKTIDDLRENITRSVEAGRDAYSQKKQELTSQLESQIKGTTDGV
jgi:gas vesicle protein